ncbi:MAG: M23 family metallopeptidase [Bacteroidia bacterium]|nr:M23 family metallopeptidase [Bacteroidia bacterium]
MWEKIQARFKKKYRVQFIDHESLGQSRLLIVRPVLLWILFSAFCLAVIAGTASTIIYTPFIREAIPGYTNPELEEKYAVQKDQVARLEAQVSHQDSMLNSLRIVFGDADGSFNLPGTHQEIAEANEANNYDYPNPEEHPHFQDSDGAGVPEGQPQPRELVGYKTVKGVPNLLPPVNGIVTNAFKAANSHFGVDIVADEKALILSVADGFVIFSEYSNQTGYVIGIHHGNNLVSFYKHNSQIYKKVGSKVFAGEAIAVIGNSGENSTGPHLHFELWYQGQPVDPNEYMILN